MTPCCNTRFQATVSRRRPTYTRSIVIWCLTSRAVRCCISSECRRLCEKNLVHRKNEGPLTTISQVDGQTLQHRRPSSGNCNRHHGLRQYPQWILPPMRRECLRKVNEQDRSLDRRGSHGFWWHASVWSKDENASRTRACGYWHRILVFDGSGYSVVGRAKQGERLPKGGVVDAGQHRLHHPCADWIHLDVDEEVDGVRY